jgi:hypothetical protein
MFSLPKDKLKKYVNGLVFANSKSIVENINLNC